MNLDGNNFTNFPNLRVKGDGSAGPGAVRFKSTGDYEQTIQGSADYTDANKTITLPAKTGTLGVSGTFSVGLAAIGAGSWSETSVTVTGIRAEDGLIVSVQDTFNTVTTDRPMAFLAGAAPANGGIHMTFSNPSGTATIPNTIICGYTAVR